MFKINWLRKKGINEGKIKHIELSFNYPRDDKEKNIYILTKQEQNKITNYVLNNCTPKNIGFLISLYSGIGIGVIGSSLSMKKYLKV